MKRARPRDKERTDLAVRFDRLALRKVGTPTSPRSKPKSRRHCPKPYAER
jgi:hypothetical protein